MRIYLVDDFSGKKMQSEDEKERKKRKNKKYIWLKNMYYLISLSILHYRVIHKSNYNNKKGGRIIKKILKVNDYICICVSIILIKKERKKGIKEKIKEKKKGYENKVIHSYSANRNKRGCT